MTVETLLTLKDYTRLNLALYYRKPMSRLITVIGVVSLVSGLIQVSGFVPELAAWDTSWIQTTVFGLLAIGMIPLSIMYQSRKNYHQNKGIQEPITYTFQPDKVSIVSRSFKSEMVWSQYLYVKELKDFFLLYQNKQIVNPIPKKYLTNQQEQEFREIIASVPGLSGKKR
jgi:hypothetical protein